MKNLKFFIKCLCFIMIFGALFIVVQENIRDKWSEGEYNTSVKIDGFYAEEENSLDVIFFGSSQMYAQISPAVMFEKYGFTSYDFCANEQPLWVTYYYMKEAFKHQRPKVAVLDVFTVYGYDLEEEGVMHINLDDLPFNMNKIRAIQDGVPKNLRYSYYFPIAKYHNTWTDLYQGKMEFSFHHEKDINKGYSPFIFAMQYDDKARDSIVNQSQVLELPELANTWLHKIIELCEEEDIPLVLIKTPNGSDDRQRFYNSVSIIANEENVPFYNMNVLLDGQAHPNIIQAEKITTLLGEYLVSNYDFEDKRNNDRYKDWNDSVELFHRQYKKCEIISASDFVSYIPLLNDDKYIILIASKNQNNNTYDSNDIAYLNEQLALDCRLDIDYLNGYFAIIDGGNVIAESTNEALGYITDDLGISYETTIDNLQLKICSSGSIMDGKTSLIVNGTDFSMDCDGINIAIYDKSLGEMVEMSAFDLNDNMNMLRK